ncbi:MAG: cytochrome c-type biogenesis CcmF C-terminal domain-containing protein, partial [Stellaceae bacterium]
QFAGVDQVPGANFSAARGTFLLRRGNELIAELHPERRFFPLQQQTTAKTAIHSNLLADVYLALGDPDGKGEWAVRAYWKPLVPWIWIGAVIMAAGGVMSLSDRRWRVGAAVRRRRLAPLPAPAE